jgi:DNA topoisomerase-1
MTDAEFDATKVEIKSTDDKHIFTANGQILVFDGFLKCWPYSTFKDEALPNLNDSQKVELDSVKGEQHFTKPPAMFNTASLVKKLEEEGIGRPSTYATIIDTLLTRQYIDKKGKAFVPTDLGKKICEYLLTAFPELMNVNFTARIEDQLDDVANANKVWFKVVDDFYKELAKRLDIAKSSESTKGKDVTEITCPKCGKYKLVKRFSKFGAFYGCDGYSTKECLAMFKIGENGEPIVIEIKEKRYLEGVKCDKCGSKIVIRVGKKSGKEFCGCDAFPKCHRMFSLDGKPFEFKNKNFKKKKSDA